MSANSHIVCPHCDTTNRIPDARLDDKPKCGNCRRSIFESHPVALTADNFHKHIRQSDIPVLVDFWAPWCGPCQMMAPAYEQAAGELEPRVRVAKVNTEAEPGLGTAHGIRGIPTLVIFRGGQEIARQSGAMGAADIVRWVSRSL
jgi:thioredoxin 2